MSWSGPPRRMSVDRVDDPSSLLEGPAQRSVLAGEAVPEDQRLVLSWRACQAHRPLSPLGNVSHRLPGTLALRLGTPDRLMPGTVVAGVDLAPTPNQEKLDGGTK